MTRRPYLRPLPRATWYLRQGRYRAYMLRELTCLITALYTVLLLAAVAALASGQPQRWDDFLASQQHPAWMVVHGVSLIFFWVFQTAPWFRLAPKAMPLPTHRFPAAPRMVVAGHYAVWLALSVAVLRLTGVI